MLATVADKQHVDLTEFLATVRAKLLGLVNRRRLGEWTRLPVRPLHRPGDDVLETAEDRAALARRLVGPKAVGLLDPGTAPGASFRAGPCHRPSIVA
jgi:hypothetical protein